MDEEVAQKFINSVVKNLQVLCHSNVDFNKNVEVIGHLYLNVDSCTKLNYIVNEKVCRNESSSTVFVSNSFHAEVGVKKKEKEQGMKNTNEMSPRIQRSQSRDDFPRRQSTDVNNMKRDHQGHYPPEPKIPRLSDQGGHTHSESRQSSTYRSPFSPNSRSRHSQETSNSVQKSPIEIDLTKVKKEFISGSSSGGCDMDAGGGNNDPSSRPGSSSFTTETESIDFSTAFPISLHSNHTLVTSALNIPDITANNNTTSSASSIDQKPFIHDSNIEPQFSPMIAGGSPRLRPPWMGEHSGSQSTASPNFPDMFRFAKRSRTVFTHFQLQTLEEVFQMSPYLTAVQKRELSGALDMTIETLSKWFQNRRQRPKKSDPDLEKFKRPDLQLFVENALETDNVIPSAPNSDTCTSGNSDRISDTDSDVKVMVVSPVDDIDKD